MRKRKIHGDCDWLPILTFQYIGKIGVLGKNAIFKKKIITNTFFNDTVKSWS